MEQVTGRRHGRSVALLILVVAAIALMASAASASAASFWYTGSPAVKLAGTAPVKAEATETIHWSTTWSGEPIEFTATGAECVGCQLENGLAREVTQATGKETLRLTGAKVVKPGGCTIQGASDSEAGRITFKPETIENVGERSFTLSPVVGNTAVSLKFGGGSCGLAGNYNINGPSMVVNTAPYYMWASVPTHTITSITGLQWSNGPMKFVGGIAESLVAGGNWSAH